MDKFEELFNQYTHGEYDYLRVKGVDINTEAGVATISMYVREDMYDNFDNNVIKVLESFFRMFVKRNKLRFMFERLVISNDIATRYLVEYISVNFPFVAANIFLDNVSCRIEGNTILCSIPVPDGIAEYVHNSKIADAVQKEMQRYFMTPCTVSFAHAEKEVEMGQQDLVSHISNLIEVSDVQWMCGRKGQVYNAPVMLSSINQEGDKIVVCGKCDEIKEYTFSEEEIQKNRGKKYRYSFTLNDTTGTIKVFFRTKEDTCPLRGKSGLLLLVVGRVYYSDRSQSFGISADSVFSCQINFAKIEEALRPLPPPDNYRFPVFPVQYSAKPVQLAIGEDVLEDKYLSGTQVFLYMRTTGDNVQPYSICAIKVEHGKPTTKYESYVYMADTLGIEIYLKNAVSAAPRMADLIPDLVKFTQGSLLVTLDLDKVQPYLTDLAAKSRYAFACDWYDANLLCKKGKNIQNFATVLHNHGIALRSSDAYDCAIALFELYAKLNLR